MGLDLPEDNHQLSHASWITGMKLSSTNPQLILKYQTSTVVPSVYTYSSYSPKMLWVNLSTYSALLWS